MCRNAFTSTLTPLLDILIDGFYQQLSVGTLYDVFLVSSYVFYEYILIVCSYVIFIYCSFLLQITFIIFRGKSCDSVLQKVPKFNPKNTFV